MLTKIYVRSMLFWTSDEGATATEYGLLVFFIAIAIVGGVAAFGNTINAWYDEFGVAVGKW